MVDREGAFELHSRVKHKGNGRIGIVVAIYTGNQYQVFFGSDEQPIIAGHDLEPAEEVYRFVDGQELLRDLLLFKLRRPLSDTLYSYAASRTNFEVYQFKPVVKFVNNPGQRILIADEVGLGKTIEACLIYLELKARAQGNLPRVLVVCPAGLTRKWQDELYSRFGEQFSILDGVLLEEFFRRWELDRSGATIKGICSLERLRPQAVVQRITDLNIQFDLVIVDEAHHMRNPETLSFDLGEVLSASADAMVLLTATPVQLRALDLFYLLNILDPGEFESPDLFDHQLEPNRFINRAISAASRNPPDIEKSISELNQAPTHIRANPYYVEALALLDRLHGDHGRESTPQRVEAIRNLYKLNTLSHLFNRSRRSEVGAGTKRNADTVSVMLTALEQTIYDTALDFARARAEHLRGYAFALGLIQIERQIASSIGGFKIVVDNFLRGRRTPIEVEQSSSEIGELSVIKSEAVYELAEALTGLYRELGAQDSKFDKFREGLDRLLPEHPKIIVFSFFKRTLEYLRNRLSNLGYTVDVIHGDVPPLERQRIIDRFQEETNRQVLLSSEVGAEGLDFQFCDAIINYDLPWNPMKVEQRIGRIDRYGQQSDKVAVASFFLKGTIEERILLRLYDRIGVFRESIGELEPILGDIVRELSYEVITKRLTPREEAELLERHLASLEHKKRDLQEFENNRYELLGHDDLFSEEVEQSIASGRYVSAKEIQALCFSYLANRFPRCRVEPVGGDNRLWKFVPDRAFDEELERFLSRPGSRGGPADREFFQKVSGVFRQGGPTGVPITFNSDLAHHRRLLLFVNIWHPLARMAFEYFDSRGYPPPEQRVARTRIFTVDRELEGDYHLFLFSIASQGVVPSHELFPVLVNREGEISDSASANFLRVLQGTPSFESLIGGAEFSPEMFERLKRRAHQHMGTVRTAREHSSRQRNEALVAVRKASLERTFQAKMRRAQERLDRAQNQQIIRMHQGEIRNLTIRMARAIDELEARKQVSVAYEPVAYGLVELRSAEAVSTE